MTKKITALLLCFCMCLAFAPLHSSAAAEQFIDVPKASFAYDDILLLRELNITSGVGGGRFSPYRTITRAEFVSMLSRLMKWDASAPTALAFDDLSPNGEFAYAYPHIWAAVQHKAFDDGGSFRPGDFITREEIAVMLINTLGYTTLSQDKLIKGTVSPFTDVSLSTHPATYPQLVMAYDFGVISGIPQPDGTYVFSPEGQATREQAAAMVVRLYRRCGTPMATMHSFYHTPFGKDQLYMLQASDSTSFGWSKLEYWNSKSGSYLNMTAQNSNNWYPDANYQELIDMASSGGRPANLAVYMDTYQKVTLPDGTEKRDWELILNDPAQRASAIKQMCDATDMGFTGITIDFEGFKNVEQAPIINTFLSELNAALLAKNPSLLLYIAVPVRDWYKAYDFKAIGEICDKVVLMAHDYAATSLPEYMANTDMPKTAQTPFNRIYSALRDVTNPIDGVQDRSKIMLALSFAYTRWEIKDGKLSKLTAGRSSTSALYARLMQPETERFYDDVLQAPAARYFDSTGGTTNVVWYEDSRSISAKIDLAAMFGIKSVSLWQLGVVPDYSDAGIYFNVWETIQNYRRK